MPRMPWEPLVKPRRPLPQALEAYFEGSSLFSEDRGLRLLNPKFTESQGREPLVS